MPLGVEKTTRPTKGKISPSKVYNMTNDELTRERFHVHTQCTKTHVHNVPIGLRLCITAGRCAYIRAVSKSTSLSCRSSVYIYAYIDRCRWLSPTVVRSFHIRLFLLFEILRYIFRCFCFFSVFLFSICVCSCKSLDCFPRISWATHTRKNTQQQRIGAGNPAEKTGARDSRVKNCCHNKSVQSAISFKRENV